MDQLDEYELWLDAYTPETIPMNRLAEYLAALARLLGHQSNVHFSAVAPGSTRAIAVVEREAAPKVAGRVAHIGTGAAANDAIAAFNEINKLLRLDNAVGQLRHRPHHGAEAVVIQFPGRDSPAPEKFGPFKEAAEVDGELVRIGGRDTSAHATIVDADGTSWSAELPRELAQRIAPYLYKGPVLRVVGEARWEREESGQWKMLGFKMTSFSVLDDVDLNHVTQQLRSLRNSDWSEQSDIDASISRLRGHEDGLH